MESNPYICWVPACGGTVKVKKLRLCGKHYHRYQRYGDPLHETYTRGETNVGKTCSHPSGCPEPAYKKQLCQAHYMQLPEQVARKADWYQGNREICIARAVEWEKTHPEIRRAINARRKFQATKGMDDFDKELSVSYRLAIKDDPCFYCGEHKDQMHDDHYVSLVNGGTDHWWNLVRACAKCNWVKNRRNGDLFAFA